MLLRIMAETIRAGLLSLADERRGDETDYGAGIGSPVGRARRVEGA